MTDGGGADPTGASLSSRNPRIQHLRRLLGRRRSRQDEGRIVLEGPTLLADALAAGAPIEAVYLDEAEPELLVGPLGQAVSAAGVPVLRVETGVLARLSDAVHPRPVLAVAERRVSTLSEFLAADPGGLVLVLVEVADPGNGGSLVRTAEAVGATAVVVTGGSVDLLGPKAVRASAGSVLRVPVVEAGDPADAVDALRAVGFRAVGAAAAGGRAPREAGLVGDVALVLGSEAHGLPPSVLARLDAAVTLPMRGRVESLNVAVAGSVLAFGWTQAPDASMREASESFSADRGQSECQQADGT